MEWLVYAETPNLRGFQIMSMIMENARLEPETSSFPSTWDCGFRLAQSLEQDPTLRSPPYICTEARMYSDLRPRGFMTIYARVYRVRSLSWLCVSALGAVWLVALMISFTRAPNDGCNLDITSYGDKRFQITYGFIINDLHTKKSVYFQNGYRHKQQTNCRIHGSHTRCYDMYCLLQVRLKSTKISEGHIVSIFTVGKRSKMSFGFQPASMLVHYLACSNLKIAAMCFAERLSFNEIQNAISKTIVLVMKQLKNSVVTLKV
jgi:hypothetical protein